jgi:hypothetical protein
MFTVSFEADESLSTEGNATKGDVGVTDDQSNEQRAVLDPSLRERVVGRIEPFVDALDAAVVNREPETIEDLQEAADELMRAIARVMLELGRSSDRG